MYYLQLTGDCCQNLKSKNVRIDCEDVFQLTWTESDIDQVLNTSCNIVFRVRFGRQSKNWILELPSEKSAFLTQPTATFLKFKELS